MNILEFCLVLFFAFLLISIIMILLNAQHQVVLWLLIAILSGFIVNFILNMVTFNKVKMCISKTVKTPMIDNTITKYFNQKMDQSDCR